MTPVNTGSDNQPTASEQLRQYGQQDLPALVRSSGLSPREISVLYAGKVQETGVPREEAQQIYQEAAPLLRAAFEERETTPEEVNSSAAHQTPELITVRGDRVTMRHPRWHWKNRLVIGVNLLAGEGGIGKGLISALIAARTTQGASIGTDGEALAAGEVLVISNEDDINSVLAPRFEVAGADMPKVHFVEAVRTEGKEQFIDLAAHTSLIAARLEANPAIRIIFIDPVTNHINTQRLNPNADADVRSVLVPLQAMAEKYSVAIVLVLHPNKKEDLSAKNRVGGSVAWVNFPRMSWQVGLDPKDKERLLLVPLKFNLIKRGAGGLAFRISDKPMTYEGKAEAVPFVVWDGPTSVTAEELMQRRRGVKREDAMHFLEGLLATAPMEQKKVIKMAEKRGISEATLLKAKSAAGVKSVKRGKRWTWHLPPTRGKKRRAREGGTL